MIPKYAFSINNFCTAHDMSRGLFYDLLKRGDGPEILKVGRRTLITIEAAEQWRKSYSNLKAKNKEVL